MHKTIIALGALGAMTVTAAAGDLRETVVKSHPSQGDVAQVDGAMSRLVADESGIFINLDTTGLTPGHVHTLWLVVINNPSACETENCTSKDVLKRSDLVKSDVGYAGGVIVDEDGTGNFAYFQPTGALNGGWIGHGLGDTASAEIHLVVNDHGPVIDGRVSAMLSTYRDGCSDESIPAPMPATARAQGEAGPNTCRLMQFSIFKAAEPSS